MRRGWGELGEDRLGGIGQMTLASSSQRPKTRVSDVYVCVFVCVCVCVCVLVERRENEKRRKRAPLVTGTRVRKGSHVEEKCRVIESSSSSRRDTTD